MLLKRKLFHASKKWHDLPATFFDPLGGVGGKPTNKLFHIAEHVYEDEMQGATSVIIQSVERAVKVLQTLGNHPDGLALGALAESVGFSPSSVHHILRTLQRHGFVDQMEDRTYKLGQGIFDLVHASSKARSWTSEVLAAMEALKAEFGETVLFGILGETAAVVAGSVESDQSLRVAWRVGDRLPLHCSALGKSILSVLDDSALDDVLSRLDLVKYTPATIDDAEELRAHIAEVRRNGYSLDLEERDAGVCCIGVPIVPQGDPRVSGISISMPAARFRAIGQERLAAALQKAAARLKAAAMSRTAVRAD